MSSPTPVEPSSSAAAAATDLRIVYEDGAGATTTWRLTCEPPGGNHPDPGAACQALTDHGATALPPVRTDVACTDIYGGAQQASVSGVWQGRRVVSSFSRVNGCEIGRWDALRGLLPPGGV